jgi:hypothetical protein
MQKVKEGVFDLNVFFCYPLIAMSTAKRFLVLLIALTAGCSGGATPGGIIPQEKFADIYFDLLVAAGTGRDTSAVPMRTPADSILARRGVTRNDYRNTIGYYNRDPESWRGFLADVIRRGTERENKKLEEEPR